jgi:hypothetical protein
MVIERLGINCSLEKAASGTRSLFQKAGSSITTKAAASHSAMTAFAASLLSGKYKRKTAMGTMATDKNDR